MIRYIIHCVSYVSNEIIKSYMLYDTEQFLDNIPDLNQEYEIVIQCITEVDINV